MAKKLTAAFLKRVRTRRLSLSQPIKNEYLQHVLAAEQGYGEMIGVSPTLRNVSQQIDLVAPTDSKVLVLGESGAGKELVARELHRRSARSQRPLIKGTCGAIPRELFESEFYGHVRGSLQTRSATASAVSSWPDGGTLFLDEVGEVPLDLQSKLLRVLQDGEIERIGEERT